MKKQTKRKRISSAGRFRRLPLLLVVMAAASVAIGAVTVFSGRLAGASAPQKQAKGAAVAEKTGKNYVTVKVAGRDVQVDSQTGQIKPLTPEEAQQLAEGLKGMLNQSTEGLVQVKHEDGSVSMDLEGRFQHVMVAKTNGDGTVTQSCIHSPQEAASFFGLDPQLLGVQASGNEGSKQPVRALPGKNPIQ